MLSHSVMSESAKHQEKRTGMPRSVLGVERNASVLSALD